MHVRERVVQQGGRKAAVATGLAGTLLVAAAVPALAHASFPAYSANGFAPNPSGGTGADGSTPPYAGGTAVTVALRAAGEQDAPFENNPDTTVDVKVMVPATWTDPTCGEAKTQVKDASTNNTNQPGTVVPGWQCEIYTSGGHQIIHFWGPQVQSPGTVADSAQFWTFGVTTPKPAAQTTYDGTGGTEGYVVDQTYASGAISHWYPSEEFKGTVPPGAVSELATGLVRTVAAYVAPSTTTTSSTTSTTLATTTTTTTKAAQAVTAVPGFTG